jgi:alpha-ketoglutarate-dependent taurine dioxygenase
VPAGISLPHAAPDHGVMVTMPEVHRVGGLIGAELRGRSSRRFHWAPGSIAMWDNRQTWHFAVNDYQGQRRVMHRILLAGSKPIPAA